MFLLLMVLLNTNQAFRLETFGTAEECQIERNRIGYEMAEAYPYERDFLITCELREEKHGQPEDRHTGQVEPKS